MTLELSKHTTLSTKSSTSKLNGMLVTSEIEPRVIFDGGVLLPHN